MAIRLVAFDLDGTLIRGESCVQAIARSIGRSDEIATFEQLSMRDIVQVTAAREEMARWFRSLTGEELVASLADLRLAPRAEDAFSILRSHGVTTAIISITWRSAVQAFARRLGADHAFGTRITPTAIEHVWPQTRAGRSKLSLRTSGLEWTRSLPSETPRTITNC